MVALSALALLLPPSFGWSQNETAWNDDGPSSCSDSLESHNLESVRPPPDPTGTWAQRVKLTGLSTVPVVGNIRSVTTTYQLVTIEKKHPSNSEVTMSSEVCDLQMRNNSSVVNPEVPERFIESLANTVRPGQLLRRTDGWWLQMGPHANVIGANLRDPDEESLPTTPDDPRVFDQDGDGHPGVTVRIRGMVSGKMYLIQRGIDAWHARFQTRDRMRGCVNWTQTQRVLDSTSIFLGDGPATRQHPATNRSTVTLRRLSTPNPTCSDVLDAYE